jgi:HTH-type transcriptional regulator/antitoxin HigA
MDTLALVIEDYERKAFPIPEVDPIEAVKYGLAVRDWTQADLARQANLTRARVSEILPGHRQMSIAVIKTLHAVLGIPFEILIGNQVRPNDDNRRNAKERGFRAG